MIFNRVPRSFFKSRLAVCIPYCWGPTRQLKLPTVAGDTILEVAGGRYNLADLNVADDVLNLIQRRAKETTDLIRVGKRGKVTFEETRAAADNIGMTIDKLLKTKVGKTFNDAEIVAAGDMVENFFFKERVKLFFPSCYKI